ncbi:MAG: DUF5050 domain-containing protein [Gemmatimonadota bacterium]
MNADGSDITRLTDTPASEYYPFFSPDGSRITYFQADGDRSVIYVMDADGGNPRKLTDEETINADPDWTPDGAQIVFYSERDGNAEIYVMDADGGNQTRLTHTLADENTPSWSPDGSRLLYISVRDGNAEVYTMDADGGSRRRLTDDPRPDRVARWSPDGSKVIFYTRLGLPDSPTREQRNASWSNAEIYTVDVHSGERVRLTHNTYRDNSPVFSPDGSQIAFSSCESGKLQIHVMNADGSNIRQLTFSD